MLSFPPGISRGIFQLQESLLGRPTFDYFHELERTQSLFREDIRALQLTRLRQLLSTTLDHSPWHSERIKDTGIDPALFTWEGFLQLPCMTKEDARLHGDKMIWREAPGGIFRYNTGGSSGEPLIFYFGRKRQAVDAASRMRARRWWGINPGDREVLLWGAPVELRRTDHIKQVRDRLCNQLLLNAFEMSESRMDHYLDLLQTYQPACIYGYASSLALLAEHAEKKGRQPTLNSLKVICTTGEPLYPHQREIIGRVFNAPLSNEYGARDAGLIALESPQKQMLVNSEWVIVEILDDDGKPVQTGETGEIVITNLASEVQPFIRYRTGDMGRWSEERCRMGYGLEVMEEITGRTTDFIVRPDGTIMHALALIYVVRDTPGVKRFKIIQQDLDKIVVQIIRDSTQWTESNIKRIKEGIRKRVGKTMLVTVDIVDDIPTEASGKYRYVIRNDFQNNKNKS